MQEFDKTENTAQHEEREKGPAIPPRPGHKYVSRTWDGTSLKWNYEYRDQPHEHFLSHDVPFVHPEDLLHTTSYKVEDTSAKPEEAHEGARLSFLNKEGSYQLDFPKLGKLDVHVKKATDSLGKERMRYAATMHVGDKSFDIGPYYEFGELEKELLQETRSTDIFDKDGSFVARIVPHVGNVTYPVVMQKVHLEKENIGINIRVPGYTPDLIPSYDPPNVKTKDKPKKYRIIFSDKYETKEKKTGKENWSVSLEDAKKTVARVANVPISQPGERNLKTFIAVDKKLRGPLWDKYRVKVGKSGNKRTYDRSLAITPEHKDKLIHEVAVSLYPLIWKVARTTVKVHPSHNLFYENFDPKDRGMVDSVASDVITGFAEGSKFPSFKEVLQLKEANKDLKDHIKLTKESPVYQAIEHEIDNYGLDNRSLFQRLAGTYKTISGSAPQLFGAIRRYVVAYMTSALDKKDRIPVFKEYTENDLKKIPDSSAYGEDLEDDTGTNYPTDPEDISQYLGHDDEIDEGMQDLPSRDPMISSFSEEEIPEGTPRAEKETLDQYDLDYFSPEISSWVDAQRIKLINASDKVKDTEQKAYIDTIKEALVKASKNRETLKKFTNGFEDLLKEFNLAHLYVKVIPFIKRGIVKKSLDFIKIDLLKASSPDKILPNREQNPEYYSHNGILLNRAIPNIGTATWNPAYNAKDKRNLWMAKWKNEETGNDDFAYALDDMRGISDLDIHNKLAIFSVRLKQFRQKISTLTNSGSYKDRLTGLILLLIDQGMFELRDVLSIVPEAVIPQPPLVSINGKLIYMETRALELLIEVLQNSTPGISIFHMSTVSGDSRMFGPNYINSILQSCGISYEDLRMYQINRDFFTKRNDWIKEGADYDNASLQAATEVMQDLGYIGPNDSPKYEDVAAFLSSHISTIEIRRSEQEAIENGTPISGDFTAERKTQYPLVDLNLEGETRDEKLFNQVINSTPFHQYL